MERLLFYLLVLMGLIVLITLAIVIEKYSHSPITKYIGRVGLLVLGIAAILQALQIDPHDWIPTAPTGNATIVPAVIPDPQFTAPTVTDAPYSITRTGVAPIYYASLRTEAESPDWHMGGDNEGESGYDNRGYFVASKKGGRSYFVLSRVHKFDDFSMEVNVTPLTDSRVTAFVVVVGWEDDGGAHLFVVAPDGHCGLAIPYGNEMRGIVKDSICPLLERDKTSRVRLEVYQETMRAIIDGRLIKEYALDGYDEGFLGLGVLNYAPAGIEEEVKVRFDDLTVWALP